MKTNATVKGVAASEYGKVVGLVETRPVCRSSKSNELIPGDSLAFLDLLLVNHRGGEMAVRVPVSEKVVDFYDITKVWNLADLVDTAG